MSDVVSFVSQHSVTVRGEEAAVHQISILIPVSSSFEDNFNFSLMYTSDCESSALCTASQPMDALNCEVYYGRNSSYEGFDGQIEGIFNQIFTLRELEPETMYYVEAVFNTRSNGVAVYYHYQTNFICTGESELYTESSNWY